MNKFDQIKKIINESNLANEDKINLYLILTSLPSDFKEETFDFIIEKPKVIYQVAENYKKKKEIIRKQDKQAWQELLKEEEKMLESMATDE